MSLQDALKELATALEQTRAENYCAAAALAFTAYDLAVYFGDEVEHIWRQRWSLPKVLYIIIRYYSLSFIVITFAVSTTTGLSSKFCHVYLTYYDMAADGIIIPLVNFVYILRVFSLYHRKLIMIPILAALWITDTVVIWVIVGRQTHSIRVVEIPSFIPWPGCAATSDTKGDLAPWITAIVIATCWMVMTLGRFVAIATQGLKKPSVSEIIHHSKKLPPLLVSLVHDGLLFYFPIVCVLVTCMITVIVIDGPLKALALPWMPAIYSYAGSHLILNLRIAAEPSNWGDTTKATIPLAVRRPNASTTTETESEVLESDDVELHHIAPRRALYA